jgi:hypothetical protein
LGGNDLGSVPTAALSVLENLHKLELPENRITDISDGDFEGTIIILILIYLNLFLDIFSFNIIVYKV